MDQHPGDGTGETEFNVRGGGRQCRVNAGKSMDRGS